MPFSRQRPRVPPTGRITVRLTPVQRDLFVADPTIPRSLVHELRHAPVREGKLNVRVDRGTLDRLIAVAANAPAADRRIERQLATLLRYLESLEDRFADEAVDDRD